MTMFDNQIAIVTGGESGIGAACAKLLGDAGARVVIT
jgi:NAD(P)-dependent dehydrogenase (short-subunit alcohol dehydrogenase family)